MSSEFSRGTNGDERLGMLAALVNGDVALAYRLATELLAHGVPFAHVVGVPVVGGGRAFAEGGRRRAAAR